MSLSFIEQIKHDFNEAHLKYYSILLNFEDVWDFAATKAPKIGQKITQKGGRVITCDPAKTYPCGAVCRSQSKDCNNPIEGQAKTYAKFLELQGKREGKIKGNKKKPDLRVVDPAKKHTEGITYQTTKVGTKQVAIAPDIHSNLFLEHSPIMGWQIVGKDHELLREPKKADGTQQAFKFKTREAAETFAKQVMNKAKRMSMTTMDKSGGKGEEWEVKANEATKRLLDGEEMTIDRYRGGTATIRYIQGDGKSGVNFLDITENGRTTIQPMMTREALENYVSDLHNPKLDKAYGMSANPRFASDSKTSQRK